MITWNFFFRKKNENDNKLLFIINFCCCCLSTLIDWKNLKKKKDIFLQVLLKCCNDDHHHYTTRIALQFHSMQLALSPSSFWLESFTFFVFCFSLLNVIFIQFWISGFLSKHMCETKQHKKKCSIRKWLYIWLNRLNRKISQHFKQT